MSRNIFAHTAPGAGYPGYVSVNQEADGISVTTRTSGNQHATGITIPEAEAVAMANAILARLAPNADPKPAALKEGKKA